MKKPNGFNIYGLILLIILPLSVSAEVPSYYDQPDSGYVSNVVIDFLVHNNGIWMATGEGLNYSFDGGDTWLLYDESNGLPSSSISAMFSVITATGSRIWIASNHEENIAGSNVALSDGVSYSDDNGLTWNQIDFSLPPNDIDYVLGGDRTIFDISGHYDHNNSNFDDWMFFTAFAGGFLASKDGGMSWRRIYPSRADSIQFNTPNAVPSLKNRYFSVEVDTTHGDTLYVWAGTAGGLLQYVFAEPKDKPYSKFYNDLVISSDTNFIYYGGDNGFTRGTKAGKPFVSKFLSDGLPGEKVTAMLEFGGKLFLGTVNSDLDNTSSGLAISTDYGDSFSAVNFPGVVGADRVIEDFAVLNDRIYMAADQAGLFVSTDTGLTWSHIFVDSSDVTTSNLRNNVHALEAWGDTLNVGTDSGLVRLYMTPTGDIDSSFFKVYPESNNSSTQVMKIKTQLYQGTTEVLWTINTPLDGNVLSSPVVTRALNGGQDEATFVFNDNNYDINFFGDTAFIAGVSGVYMSNDGANPISRKFDVSEYQGSVVVDSFNDDTVTVMKIAGDTVVCGSEDGFAVSLDRGETFDIYRVNQDTLAADIVLNYNSSIFGIGGDWIPALEVQNETSDPFARVWISTRPTFGGANGISVGFAIPIYEIDNTVTPPDTTILRYERIWSQVHDQFAWNFAFNGDTVFAATNDGLIYAEGDSLLELTIDQYDWKTLELKDAQGYPLILPETPIYAVKIIGSTLWVGTDDRTVKVNLLDMTDQTPYYVLDSTSSVDEVYAFPVPYSHVQNSVVEFRFVLEKDANVTLEIYDFAMNLVNRVIDNEPFTAGYYPMAGYGRRTWDGKNGEGDKVAVGMYYFKLTLSTGEVRWGKLGVIP